MCLSPGARGHRHAKDAASVLVETMHWQRNQPPIGGRQRIPAPIKAAVVGAQFTIEKIGKDAERRQISVFRRYGKQARPLVDDRECRVEI